MSAPLRAAALALLAAPAAAEGPIPDDFLPEWDLSGSLHIRGEFYDVTGDETFGVFPFENEQGFGEAFLTFRRQVSLFERQSGFFSGLINFSRYREQNRGLVPERFNFEWEKGDAEIPFRLTLGDSFAFFSPRTIQRSVKGLALELQPGDPAAPNATSIQLFGGAEVPTYRDFEDPFTTFAGVSVLHQRADGTALIGNLVGAFRHEDDGQAAEEQIVATLGAERPFRLGAQEITAETEIGLLHGDTDFSARSETDLGLFAELRGRPDDQRWDWGMTFERYGEHYQPFGAAVASGRSSVEARASWRFEEGLIARGRAQRFVDAIGSGNPTEIYLVGANLSGPFLPEAGVTGSLDLFAQDAEDELSFRDETSLTGRLDLFAPLSPEWTGRAGLFGQTIDDRVAGERFTQLALDLAADRTFTADDIFGVVSPGLSLRRFFGGASAAWEIGPSLALTAQKGPHAVSLSYRPLFQDRRGAGAEDLLQHELAGSWSYASGVHRVSLDGSISTRDPETGRDTTSWTVGLSYRIDFQRPAIRRETAPVRLAAAAGGLGGPGGLLAFRPGTAAAKAMAEAGRYGPGLSFGGVRAWPTAFFPRLTGAQRLFLDIDSGRLRRAGVIVEFAPGSDAAARARDFARLEEELIRAYGPPALAIDKGRLDAGFERELNLGRFARLREWAVEGGTLRLGVPRRLDRQARIEIQIAGRFPPPEEKFWSIEALR